MSAMAMSSLNPNAPLFIPAAYRQVEDYSPEWWELVQTTAWFRDHWFRQHQLHEAQHDAALAALPDDLLLDAEDLFYAPPDQHLVQRQDTDVFRSLASPRVAPASPWEQQQQQQVRPAQQHGGFGNGAIRQPR